MSFSNNNFSEEALQSLANSLFKARPAAASPLDQFGETSHEQTAIDNTPSDFNIATPQTSLNDPFFKDGNIPASVAGDGKSPFHNAERLPDLPQSGNFDSSSSNKNVHVNDLLNRNQQDSLTQYNSAAIHSSRDFYQQSPLPNNGQNATPIVGATAGVNNAGHALPNFSPDGITSVSRNYLPFEKDHIAELDALQSLINGIVTFKHAPQIPCPVATSAFYFVNEQANIFPIEKLGYPGEIQNDGSVANTLHTNFDVHAVRKDFPILSEFVNGRRLIWLDNAATTQKPQAVIDRLAYFYQHENSNIHRAAHELAARATDAYEDARNTVKTFLNAKTAHEIVFTRGTTESINLVAATWGEQNLQSGDDIIISHLEHHANIVPWQLLQQRKGFNIKVIPVNDSGELLIEEYKKLLTPNTKLVAFTHVSNALGTVTPAKQIIDLAHGIGAKVLLDGAQSVSHLKVDLQYLDADFFVLSGHKIFAPTGIGILYGKEDLLNALPPYQGGGNMIQDVTFEKTIFHNAPARFEAGTGNIADAVGLGAAIKYVQKIGIENIGAYEHHLLEYATYLFKQIPGIQLIGTAKEKASVLSFTLKNRSNNDVGNILNEHGIAVRTGHHCAQPILRRLGHESSVRPSLAFYNTKEEIDTLANIVYRIATS